MDETHRIEEIVKSVNLERKTRVTKNQKQAYSELKSDIESIKDEIGKLHLMLWHTGYKGDYHSLSLDEAMERLKQIRQNIDDIISTHL
jgi:predicted  nucleic acid-binding Zn-ribbon protein